MIDKGTCDKGFIWNPSNCQCKCDKSCDIGEYLDYKNCKCRKKLVDKLVEECTENIVEVKIAEITLKSCAQLKITINAVLARCTLCYFQKFLQSTLDLVLIMFMFIIKKMFLDMIINQQIININGKYQRNKH